MSTSDLQQLLSQADACLRSRKYKDALSLYKQALEQNPDLVDAHRGAGLALFFLDRYQEAIHHFERWMRIKPLDARPYINMGAAYTRMGDFQKAAEILQRAVQRDAKSFEAYYNLGLAYRKAGQFGMAMNAYKQAVLLNPDSADAHLNLGNVLVKLGNPRKAIEHYEKALELDPTFEKAKRGLEKAQEMLSSAPQIASPFGRLVDEQTLAKNIARTEIRELSAKERLEDRQLLQRLSEQLGAVSNEWLEHLKEHLAPALHELHRAILEEEEGLLLEKYEVYKTALMQHEQLRSRVRELVSELEKHEERMKKPADSE